MERATLLEELIDVIDPIDEITEDTVIADCDDIDSLALFNIVIYLKTRGILPSFNNILQCKTVRDILDLALSAK